MGNNTITDAQTKQLLLGKEPLDISGKKITLEANPIFYFMGECMNESLGLKIGKITITETTQELGLNLYAESHSIAAQAYDTQKNLTIKVF
ncbi:TPA: hypothetical protein DEP21_03465 [Patescibacteria group bacterium]|nr:hypothetical protein [Candidatus Gracilibacteria bacterium]